MANAVNGCPADHPVALPLITEITRYIVPTDNGTTGWHLSSDNYSRTLPGGFSAHADFFNGWDQNTMDTWTKYCDDEAKNCSYAIGDGRELY
jgi:hypothetical protein